MLDFVANPNLKVHAFLKIGHQNFQRQEVIIVDTHTPPHLEFEGWLALTRF